MKKEPKYVGKTLAWCNTQRILRCKRAVKKLPKGERYAGSSCPCGKVTGLIVHHDAFYDQDGFVFQGKTPSFVRKFTIAFDEGKLPQYDIEK